MSIEEIILEKLELDYYVTYSHDSEITDYIKELNRFIEIIIQKKKEEKKKEVIETVRKIEELQREEKKQC